MAGGVVRFELALVLTNSQQALSVKSFFLTDTITHMGTVTSAVGDVLDALLRIASALTTGEDA